ncbi:MAG: pilus assembly protein PilY, partial [Ramlibacter sp.]|nr:pilus assembly protein PilY [Ramlibacter sp.]
MKFADFHLLPRLHGAARALAWLAAVACGTVLAATTDISNAPLFTSSTASVKPNIMFILDDSGSMASDYIPDEANTFSMTEYGFRASQCNGLGYNPSVTYSLPVTSTGTSATAGTMGFMDPSTQVSNARSISNITAANYPSAAGGTVTVVVTGGSYQSSWYSTAGNEIVTVFGSATQFFTGIVTAWNTGNGNLTIKVMAVVGSGSLSSPKVGQGLANTYFTYSGTQPKLVYAYDASANLLTGSTFYTECNSKIGSAPGSGVFTGFAVGSASTEAQNFANWKQYYTTRMNMMKTAMSLAFKGVDSRYRVGFSTISARTAAESTSFLNIRDFDATQKATFYTDLNAASPAINTPLRGALSKAGQYYS